MCRWAAYAGPPVFLEEMILSPAHSLIEQSQRATEAKTAINGDGFGLAWYGERKTPGLYRDILPAWADTNLRSLASQIRSGLFMAHVRASTGGGTNRDNCHPFAYENWSFMHNGQIAHFDQLRRSLESALSDQLYALRQGVTDSELMFLLAIQYGLTDDPVAALRKVMAFIVAQARARELQPLIRFTTCLSDGRNMHAIRFATDAHPPSLYYAKCGKDGSICLVSEPFEHPERDWTPVPPNTWLHIVSGNLTLQEFMPGQAHAAA